MITDDFDLDNLVAEIQQEVDLIKEECELFYNFDENAEKAAAIRGCVVVFPKENQLQIDIDSESAFKYFERRIKEVKEYLGWECHV